MPYETDSTKSFGHAGGCGPARNGRGRGDGRERDASSGTRKPSRRTLSKWPLPRPRTMTTSMKRSCESTDRNGMLPAPTTASMATTTRASRKRRFFSKWYKELNENIKLVSRKDAKRAKKYLHVLNLNNKPFCFCRSLRPSRPCEKMLCSGLSGSGIRGES